MSIENFKININKKSKFKSFILFFCLGIES